MDERVNEYINKDIEYQYQYQYIYIYIYIYIHIVWYIHYMQPGQLRFILA